MGRGLTQVIMLLLMLSLTLALIASLALMAPVVSSKPAPTTLPACNNAPSPDCRYATSASCSANSWCDWDGGRCIAPGGCSEGNQNDCESTTFCIYEPPQYKCYDCVWSGSSCSSSGSKCAPSSSLKKFLDPDGDAGIVGWSLTEDADGSGFYYRALADNSRKPNSVNMVNYISCNIDAAYALFNMETADISDGLITAVQIWVMADTPADTLRASIYMGDAWQTEILYPEKSVNWVSAAFTGSWSQEDLDNMQVKFTINNPSSGVRIYAMYAEVSYTAAAASTSTTTTSTSTSSTSTTSTSTTLESCDSPISTDCRYSSITTCEAANCEWIGGLICTDTGACNVWSTAQCPSKSFCFYDGTKNLCYNCVLSGSDCDISNEYCDPSTPTTTSTSTTSTSSTSTLPACDTPLSKDCRHSTAAACTGFDCQWSGGACISKYACAQWNSNSACDSKSVCQYTGAENTCKNCVYDSVSGLCNPIESCEAATTSTSTSTTSTSTSTTSTSTTTLSSGTYYPGCNVANQQCTQVCDSLFMGTTDNWRYELTPNMCQSTGEHDVLPDNQCDTILGFGSGECAIWHAAIPEATCPSYARNGVAVGESVCKCKESGSPVNCAAFLSGSLDQIFNFSHPYFSGSATTSTSAGSSSGSGSSSSSSGSGSSSTSTSTGSSATSGDTTTSSTTTSTSTTSPATSTTLATTTTSSTSTLAATTTVVSDCYQVCTSSNHDTQWCSSSPICSGGDTGYSWTRWTSGDWDCASANPYPQTNHYCCCGTSYLPSTSTTLPSTTTLTTTSLPAETTTSTTLTTTLLDERTPCTDTDKGKNYNKRGQASGMLRNGSRLNATDYCFTEAGQDKLVEYYCKEILIRNEELNCTNSCLNGACINEGAKYVVELSQQASRELVIPPSTSVGGIYETASDLCDTTNNTKYIEKYDKITGEQLKHSCGSEEGDFKLVKGEGYRITFRSSSMKKQTMYLLGEQEDDIIPLIIPNETKYETLSPTSWVDDTTDKICEIFEGLDKMGVLDSLTESWETHYCGINTTDYTIQAGDIIYLESSPEPATPPANATTTSTTTLNTTTSTIPPSNQTTTTLPTETTIPVYGNCYELCGRYEGFNTSACTQRYKCDIDDTLRWFAEKDGDWDCTTAFGGQRPYCCCGLNKDSFNETPEINECFDRIQNPGEEGVDCGGTCRACPKLEITVQSMRFSQPGDLLPVRVKVRSLAEDSWGIIIKHKSTNNIILQPGAGVIEFLPEGVASEAVFSYYVRSDSPEGENTLTFVVSNERTGRTHEKQFNVTVLHPLAKIKLSQDKLITLPQQKIIQERFYLIINNTLRVLHKRSALWLALTLVLFALGYAYYRIARRHSDLNKRRQIHKPKD